MKLTTKKLKQIIREEFKKVTESGPADAAGYVLGRQGDYGPGGPTDDDMDYAMGQFTPDKGEDPNAEDQKPFVKHFLHLLINGETKRPFTPKEIDDMDTSVVDDLASQMRDALRRSGAKRIPPLSDPGAFDPFDGQ